MSKRSLMLSTAAVALLTGAAFADTTIDSSKSEPYTTGALLSGNTGQANAGNVTITTAGSVNVSEAQGALTIDSNNWILNQGAITNKDKQGASGIHVDLSANRDFTGASFTNTAGTTIANTGIYLDSAASVSLSGNGTNKYGIYLDSAGCTTSPCTFTGDINLSSGSVLSVTGDSSIAMAIGSSAKVQGDIIFAGSATASATSTTQTATNMFGLYSAGTIQGNVRVDSGGSLSAYGQGAEAMYIAGGGVSGYIQIGGGLMSSVVTKPVTSYTQQVNTTTNPEAGPALYVGSSVGGGIAILGPSTSSTSTTAGTVTMQGTGAAIVVAPVSTTSALTIGVYTPDTADPGFSFYNRGQVQATYTNYNKSTTIMSVSGTSAALPTVLTGGFFNSGTMSSSVLTNGTGQSTTNIGALGIVFGNYVQLGENSAAKLPAPSATTPSDQAAFVNSGSINGGGTISAAVSGSRGGVAQAIVIGSQASVPSIINTGSILASVTTTDATLGGTVSSSNPVFARAIYDQSGTLTSIYNAGTISAVAGYQASQGGSVSPLDNNLQLATAIDLSGGNDTDPSGDGVTIINHSSGSRAAIINGNIIFGTGDNQVLDLLGNGSNSASVIGNVIFGQSKTRTTSGDRLVIGNHSTLQGAVITGETTQGGGLAVAVQSGGTLTLLNNSDTLKPMGFNCATLPQACTMNATTFDVQTGGTVNLGVNRSLASTGVVNASSSINFATGANLGVSYASYLPQSENQFILMTAPKGNLAIDSATLATFNNPLTRPYLLAESMLCVTSTPGCTPPSSLSSTKDALVLTVAPKTAAEIGLTPGSIALQSAAVATGGTTTLFDQANIALAADNELGAAFINGIHNAAEAQKAYNNMAPNLTGGTRAIAISITDQATGPVGARQRALRMYAKTPGEMTLWGQEFVQMIKDPGQGALDPNTGFKTDPGFKDHGFGFAIGLDGGSPKYGWYGGALTFYAGDVNELSRNSHENQQWYLLSLYSVWRGTGLFLDTKLDAGYGNIDGKRYQSLAIAAGTNYVRVAQNKHAGALISGGVSTGAMFSYGAATLMPQLSLDGLYLREEGYTENNPGSTTVGDAFDLKVGTSYAKSLRAFIGLDARYDLELWDFFLQPELRGGYRYDFLADPAKLKVAFAYADTSSVSAGPGTAFTLTGPDPSKGNFVLGGTLAATSDTWSVGLNFDLVKGTNGALQQVGTINLVGRI